MLVLVPKMSPTDIKPDLIKLKKQPLKAKHKKNLKEKVIPVENLGPFVFQSKVFIYF